MNRTSSALLILAAFLSAVSPVAKGDPANEHVRGIREGGGGGILEDRVRKEAQDAMRFVRETYAKLTPSQRKSLPEAVRASVPRLLLEADESSLSATHELLREKGTGNIMDLINDGSSSVAIWIQSWLAMTACERLMGINHELFSLAELERSNDERLTYQVAPRIFRACGASPERLNRSWVVIDPSGANVRTQVRAAGPVSRYAVDLWEDRNEDGLPDAFILRLKEDTQRPMASDPEWVDLGNPKQLCGKFVQWIWAADPPGGPWSIEVGLSQGSALPRFPRQLKGETQDDSGAIYQTWIKLDCPEN